MPSACLNRTELVTSDKKKNWIVDEDVEESCAFDANFISELEKAKKLLTEKAKIQIFSEIQVTDLAVHWYKTFLPPNIMIITIYKNLKINAQEKCFKKKKFCI